MTRYQLGTILELNKLAKMRQEVKKIAYFSIFEAQNLHLLAKNLQK